VASITIRNLEEGLRKRSRVQAATHGRAMEDEARNTPRHALNRKRAVPDNLAVATHARFAWLGGVELPEVPRQPMREPPSFDR
jgi:antitoxin FitA